MTVNQELKTACTEAIVVYFDILSPLWETTKSLSLGAEVTTWEEVLTTQPGLQVNRTYV
jgi:hypothetical protein